MIGYRSGAQGPWHHLSRAPSTLLAVLALPSPHGTALHPPPGPPTPITGSHSLCSPSLGYQSKSMRQSQDQSQLPLMALRPHSARPTWPRTPCQAAAPHGSWDTAAPSCLLSTQNPSCLPGRSSSALSFAPCLSPFPSFKTQCVTSSGKPSLMPTDPAICVSEAPLTGHQALGAVRPRTLGLWHGGGGP